MERSILPEFQIISPYQPRGDQIPAIKQLVQGIENGKKYQTLLGVTGSGKSIDYDEQIVIINENSTITRIKIGKFVEEKLSNPKKLSDTLYQKINGFFTLSFNSKDYSIETKEITEVSKHKAKFIYKITLDDNSTIRITKDHNCFRLYNCKLDLVATESLKIGDYLPLSNNMPLPKKPLRFLNLLEYNSDSKVNISDLIKKQYKNVEIIKEFLKGEFKAYNWKFDQIVNETSERGITIEQMYILLSRSGLNLRDVNKYIKIITKGNDSLNPLIPINNNFLTFAGLYISEGHCTDRYILISNPEKTLQNICKEFFNAYNLNYNQRNENDIVYFSKPFSNFFKSLGKTAKEKRITNFFYNLSNENLTVFLRAVFDGDGGVEKNRVVYTSASEKLIYDIKNLLLRFDIVSRIRKKKSLYKGANNNPIEKEYYSLTISGRENLIKFKNTIYFSLEHKKKKLIKNITEKSNTNVDVFPKCSNYIIKLRKGLKFTQKQLANQIGCARSHITLIEQNKRNPSKDLFKKIIKLDPKKELFQNILNFNFRRINKIERVKTANGYVYDISVKDNENFFAGNGNIFVHNTFTIANVIEQVRKPTLVISHNKTLAAQLYQEFSEYFPHNAVEYFVSYYDYYQPEAYLPTTDRYIEKDFDINEEIEKMRASATRSLLERDDVIVVASVSCIYGLGSPESYKNMSLFVQKGMKISKEKILSNLIDIQYERDQNNLLRGKIRIRGDTIDVWPAYEDYIAVRIELFGDEIERITHIHPISGKTLVKLDRTIIFPAKHYVRPKDELRAALGEIRKELRKRLKELRHQNKIIEAHRLQQRTLYDLELMEEIGHCPGIENYSRYFDNREEGEPPSTLMEFFPKDYLLIIDESHMTIPQIGGMREGDLSRKKNLIDYGFRLPSAYDHRPLTFREFEARMGQTIFVSATPGPYAWEKSGKNGIIEQIIRPTGLVDPEIEIKIKLDNPIDDLVEEIQKTTGRRERTLVTTLTKRMAENLADYLDDIGIRARYLHSEIKTLERTDILRSLRLGDFDVLVGINLLREGLDLPEVSLVAILDADKQGFLRNERSLIQTIGRAARNVNGRVVFYADKISESMEISIAETKRRRRKQLEYNKKMGITPQTIIKEVRSPLVELKTSFTDIKQEKVPAEDLPDYIKALRQEMQIAAKNLEFEKAAEIRDMIFELEKPKLKNRPKIVKRKNSRK
ncbi:MAG: excinuclease ABC subunit UvrB [Promethearchaeota archaeon]